MHPLSRSAKADTTPVHDAPVLANMQGRIMEDDQLEWDEYGIGRLNTLEVSDHPTIKRYPNL